MLSHSYILILCTACKSWEHLLVVSDWTSFISTPKKWPHTVQWYMIHNSKLGIFFWLVNNVKWRCRPVKPAPSPPQARWYERGGFTSTELLQCLLFHWRYGGHSYTHYEDRGSDVRTRSGSMIGHSSELIKLICGIDQVLKQFIQS